MTRDLVKNIQYCMSQNMPKFVISLLIMSLCTSILMAFTMMPMANAIVSNQISFASMLTSIGTIVATFSIQYVLQYGFFVLVFLLYSQRYAVLGHLFSGFRDFKRAAILGLIFSSVYVAILCIVTIVLNLLLAYNVIQLDFEMLILILFGVAVIALGILYLNFTFAWFILYENSRITVKGAIKESFHITKGEKLAFIVLCIKSSSFFLPLVILSILGLQLPLLVPEFEATSKLYMVLAQVFNVGYIVGGFVTLMRFSITFAAWYVSHYESPKVIDEIDKRIIHLPDYHDVANSSNDNE